jgi:hypothetical protein
MLISPANQIQGLADIADRLKCADADDLANSSWRRNCRKCSDQDSITRVRYGLMPLVRACETVTAGSVASII